MTLFRSLLLAYLILTTATGAWANPFGGVITGGGGSGSGTVTEVTGSGGVSVANGTTTPAISLTDNGVSGTKVQDNTLAGDKVISLGYAKLTGVPTTFTPASHNNTAHSETYLTTTGSAASLTNFPTLNQNTTGTAAGLSATLAIGSGGTNATTAAAARTNLGLGGDDNVSFGSVTTAQGTSAGCVTMMEGSGNGTDNVGICAPASVTTSYKIILPAAVCASGSILVSGGDNTYSCAANIAGTAGNVSGTPALPNGTTATTQTANDNSGKIATTAYVDQRYEYLRLVIDNAALTDNTIIAGPLDRAWSLDNIVMVIVSASGAITGASTDNVTVNFQYAATSAFSSPTNVYTSDVTVTGSADYQAGLNNTTPASGGYVRVIFSGVNMASGKKFYARIKYHRI